MLTQTHLSENGKAWEQVIEEKVRSLFTHHSPHSIFLLSFRLGESDLPQNVDQRGGIGILVPLGSLASKPHFTLPAHGRVWVGADNRLPFRLGFHELSNSKLLSSLRGFSFDPMTSIDRVGSGYLTVAPPLHKTTNEKKACCAFALFD